MPLYLNHSAARRRFKDLLGPANHLLITILVGLSAVERRLITECPPELHAAWNPQDPTASALRSRKMVLEMTLVRATDAFDCYVSWSRQTPSLIQQPEMQRQIDSCGRRVLQKLNVMSSMQGLNPVLSALVEVLIVWRNRAVHSLADNEVSDKTWNTLRSNEEWIRNEFRGMELGRLFGDFERGGAPSFKEIASFIRAVQSLIQEMDAALLSQLDSEQYLRDFLSNLLRKPKADETPKKSMLRNAQSIWGRDGADRHAAVISLLKHNGLSQECLSEHSCIFSDELLEKMSSFSTKALLEYLNSSGLDAA